MLTYLWLDKTNQEYDVMPLTLAHTGETVTVRHVGGPGQVRSHLSDLGFTAGTDVTVVSEIAGNLIVSVKNSRVAISREMAQRIMV